MEKGLNCDIQIFLGLSGYIWSGKRIQIMSA